MARITNVENVCSVQAYTDQTGEKKNSYRQIDRVTTFDNGGKTLELNMFPGIKYVIMPQPQPK